MAKPGILLHLRNYASAGLLSALAGVISFPILTRNLSIEEYGILGLITSSLTLFIAVGKLGMQQAVIRFFAQIKNANSVYSLGQINSTVTLVFLTLALLTTVLWLLAGTEILPQWLQYEDISTLFMIAAGTIFVRMLGSGIMNFLRAQQRSGDVAVAQVIARYLNLVFIVSLLLFSDLNPYYLLACLLLAELVGVGFAASRYRGDFHFSWSTVSAPLARAMLIYGLPLMILESLGLVLRLSDRYLIEALLGVNDLGMYSASYNLTAYLDIVVLAGLAQSVKPMYMHLWESDSKEATREFLSRGLQLYLVIGIPLIAVFSLASPHLLNFLAGSKYAPGTVIIPFVALSFLIDGAILFLAAGLYICKNTKVLMIWGAIATISNLALNYLFIPEFGILGAAVVTILSYVIFVAGVGITAFRYLSFRLKLHAPLIVTVLSVTVYAGLYRVDLGSDIATMFFQGSTGGLLLMTGLLIIDPGVRTWVLTHLGFAANAELPK